MMVRKRLPIEVQVFQVWWYAIYEDKLNPWTDLDEIRQMFPKVRNEPRKEQKRRLRRVVEKYRDDKKIVGRPENGSAPAGSLVVGDDFNVGMGLGTHSWGHGGTTTVTPSLFAMVQICLSFSGTSGLNAQLLSLSSPADG